MEVAKLLNFGYILKAMDQNVRINVLKDPNVALKFSQLEKLELPITEMGKGSKEENFGKNNQFVHVNLSIL